LGPKGRLTSSRHESNEAALIVMLTRREKAEETKIAASLRILLQL
jgi:hypothetical protein